MNKNVCFLNQHKATFSVASENQTYHSILSLITTYHLKKMYTISMNVFRCQNVGQVWCKSPQQKT